MVKTLKIKSKTYKKLTGVKGLFALTLMRSVYYSEAIWFLMNFFLKHKKAGLDYIWKQNLRKMNQAEEESVRAELEDYDAEY